MLDDKPHLAVAVVGSLPVALITIPLAHGSGSKSLSALLGTAVSLLLTAGLAVVFTELGHFTVRGQGDRRDACWFDRLIAAVPITTALAAALASGQAPPNGRGEAPEQASGEAHQH